MPETNNTRICRLCDKPARPRYTLCNSCIRLEEIKKAPECSVEGCAKPAMHKKKTLCSMHYERERRNGSTEITLRAPPSEPFIFLHNAVLTCQSDSCIIWPYGCRNGYGQIQHEGKNRTVHRLALILYTGLEPEGMEAAHGPCHNPLCINPHEGHGLSWKTPQQHAKDKIRDGTHNRGERHPLSKLKEADIFAIRLDDRPQRVIAEEYGVSQSTISIAKSGKTWKWLD